MNLNALLIRPNNTTERVVIKDYSDISKYLECQLFCTVTNVMNIGFSLYGDDEALLVHEPLFNRFGSMYYGYRIQHMSPIAGNVLALGLPDSIGDSTSLREEQITTIENTVARYSEAFGTEEIPMTDTLKWVVQDIQESGL